MRFRARGPAPFSACPRQGGRRSMRRCAARWTSRSASSPPARRKPPGLRRTSARWGLRRTCSRRATMFCAPLRVHRGNTSTAVWLCWAVLWAGGSRPSASRPRRSASTQSRGKISVPGPARFTLGTKSRGRDFLTFCSAPAMPAARRWTDQVSFRSAATLWISMRPTWPLPSVWSSGAMKWTA